MVTVNKTYYPNYDAAEASGLPILYDSIAKQYYTVNSVVIEPTTIINPITEVSKTVIPEQQVVEQPKISSSVTTITQDQGKIYMPSYEEAYAEAYKRGYAVGFDTKTNQYYIVDIGLNREDISLPLGTVETEPKTTEFSSFRERILSSGEPEGLPLSSPEVQKYMVSTPEQTVSLQKVTIPSEIDMDEYKVAYSHPLEPSTQSYLDYLKTVSGADYYAQQLQDAILSAQETAERQRIALATGQPLSEGLKVSDTTSLTTIKPSTFQPDFNKDNPYLGATLDYFRSEINTFVPTTNNPLPPSIAYMEAHPDSKIVPQKAMINPQQFNDYEYNEFIGLSPEKRFEVLINKGYIPKGSQYTGLDSNGQVTYLSPDNVMRMQIIDLWKQRTEILKDQYSKILDTLEPYKVEILPRYRSGMTAEQIKELITVGYDVDRFVKENPNQESVQILQRAGFADDIVDKAQNYIDIVVPQIIGAVTGIANELNSRFSFSGALGNPEIRNAFADTGINPDQYPSQYHLKEKWDLLTSEERNNIASAYISNPYNKNQFAAIVQAKMRESSENILSTLDIATPSIVAIGKPIADVTTGQGVNPLDIANAAIATALLSVPVLSTMGRGGMIASKAIMGTSGVYMSTQTANNWAGMTPAEQAVSLGIDALLVIGAMPSGVVSKVTSGLKTFITDETGGKFTVGRPEAVAESVNYARNSVNLPPLSSEATVELNKIMYRTLRAVSNENVSALRSAMDDLSNSIAARDSIFLREYALAVRGNTEGYIITAKNMVNDVVTKGEIRTLQDRLNLVGDINKQVVESAGIIPKTQKELLYQDNPQLVKMVSEAKETIDIKPSSEYIEMKNLGGLPREEMAKLNVPDKLYGEFITKEQLPKEIADKYGSLLEYIKEKPEYQAWVKEYNRLLTEKRILYENLVKSGEITPLAITSEIPKYDLVSFEDWVKRTYPELGDDIYNVWKGKRELKNDYRYLLREYDEFLPSIGYERNPYTGALDVTLTEKVLTRAEAPIFDEWLKNNPVEIEPFIVYGENVATPTEWEFYKIIKEDRVKGGVDQWAGKTNLEVAKKTISAIRGEVETYGLRSAVERFGFDKVKVLYPKLTNGALAAEDKLWKLRVSTLVEPMRKRVYNAAHEHIINTFAEGVPEGKFAELIQKGFLEEPIVHEEHIIAWRGIAPSDYAIEIAETKPIIQWAKGGEFKYIPTMPTEQFDSPKYSQSINLYRQVVGLINGEIATPKGEKILSGYEIPIITNEDAVGEVAKVLELDTKTDKQQLDNIVEQIKEYNEKRGMIQTLKEYGKELTMAVFPFAFEYALAEEENYQPPRFTTVSTKPEIPSPTITSSETEAAIERHAIGTMTETERAKRFAATEQPSRSPMTVIDTRIKPSVAPIPSPIPIPNIIPAPEPQPSPFSMPEPAPIPSPIPTPTPEPVPTPTPLPEPLPSPIPDIIPEPYQEPIITPVPPPVTPIPKIVIPPVITQIPQEWEKTGVPAGTIEWRQGVKWVVLPPPYRDEDKMYLDKPLTGTYKFAVGKGSAYKTLQVLGGAPTEDADVDMGWAQIHISSKGNKLEMKFAGGKEAVRERWDAEKEAMSDLEKQSYSELPESDMNERIPKSVVSRMLIPDGLDKVELPQYRTSKSRVYLVNGEYVRNNYDIDFTQGGHWKVYPKFIPENEYWIDRALDTATDRRATLLHELVEAEDMKNARGKGDAYYEAHSEVANRIEMKARNNPKIINEMIHEFLEKYRTTDEIVETDYDIEDRIGVYKGSRKHRLPIHAGANALPDRYYLGHKLRPVDLGIKL